MSKGRVKGKKAAMKAGSTKSAGKRHKHKGPAAARRAEVQKWLHHNEFTATARQAGFVPQHVERVWQLLMKLGQTEDGPRLRIKKSGDAIRRTDFQRLAEDDAALRAAGDLVKTANEGLGDKSRALIRELAKRQTLQAAA